MTTELHRPHGPDELCEEGSALYGRALRESRVPRADAEQAPCLVDFALLRPDAQDPRWLRPTAPSIALPRLREAIQEDIAREIRRETLLTEAFEPLMALAAAAPASAAALAAAAVEESAAIRVLEGLPQIQDALARALAGTDDEVLSIQPGGVRPSPLLAQSLDDAHEFLARGGSLRTLCQHTSRHSLPMLAQYEQLDGDAEVRTLDEVPERLFVFDRTVAVIPANKERNIALEIRHPALIEYFVTTFERLWRLAVPMFPRAMQLPSANGITARQHAIAGLLVEGLTDTEVADRLGMNVRTARVHIAKLASTLGSESRAQLGYLIGQSGILDPSAS
ncbi:helix-turn-helix transcriptional regulator [Streptomyces luteocolor]|uniref:helix-turn-helix transcriptional regulator n=1 Tax=Streptomyces luteocolor TaxID=285500 RepID=UPI00085364AD|nr:helix-turn-helix transcriptional regulator [Streptomyces luteocolor]MCF3122598.1 helix-turn-helix transcriptional regulator [Streptomyces arenae]